MSHLKERKEKNCLNCNAIIIGRYCSICGQENLQPQESFWHLFMHFLNDITHFDGKFFSSVKFVLFKPGYLTNEYMAGRRMSYLNPVRFYVFTSFLFFLILFSFIVDENVFKIKEDEKTQSSKKSSNKTNLAINNIRLDSLKKLESNNKKSTLLGTNNYRDKKQYDSLKTLGLTKETGLKRLMLEKDFKIRDKYGNDRTKMLDALIENSLHSIPQTLFFTLPLFALALQLLYFRKAKFYYVAHLIFTIHLYIFIYIDYLLIVFFSALSKIKNLAWLSSIELFLSFYILYYAYRAMRNFYDEGRWKTILKLSILCFSLLFISMIFGTLLFAISIYKM